MTTPSTNCIHRWLGRCALLFVSLLIACFGLLPRAQAVNPPPDGGYPGGNTAEGENALLSLTTGGVNTAVGLISLNAVTTGRFNTGLGAGTLFNTTASGDTSNNTAVGSGALIGNRTGSTNIALGRYAGENLDLGNWNFYIGNCGTYGESNTIHIGDSPQTRTFISEIHETIVTGGITVYVDHNGQLGTVPSSRRYKHDIQPMDKASETLYQLKPATFKFNSDWKGTTQYGLIADEVAEVDPQLVVRRDGETVTVRYEQINSMLLNEFLKEHNAALEERRKVEKLEGTVAALVATVKEQAPQIQKVSARLELNKPTP